MTDSHAHATPSTPLLAVSGLSVSFPGDGGYVRVLDEFDLRVDGDEVVCLVGESGSGKSVAAMTCVGLTLHDGARIDAGSIRYRGEELVGAGNARWNRLRGGEIGFVFQEPMTSLNPALTIGTQITEVLRRHRTYNRRAARTRAIELLDLVGISDGPRRVREYPHHLSGGMRQRVGIAMALAAEPRLLIADEPTTALDVTTQAEILQLLRDLRAELGMAVLFITHDLGVVAELADRVVVLYAGQVVETAKMSSIFSEPQHPYTSGLLRSLPQLSVPGARFGMIPGVVPPPGQLPAGCRFHPRCPHALAPDCTIARVPLDREADAAVRCVRAAELSLEGI